MTNGWAIAERIINELTGRRGFDAAWDDCDEDIQQEILSAIEKICTPVTVQESAQCQHTRRDQDRCADCGKMLIVAESAQSGSGEAVARQRIKIGRCGKPCDIDSVGNRGCDYPTCMPENPPASADEGMVLVSRETLALCTLAIGSAREYPDFDNAENPIGGLLDRCDKALAALDSQ